MRSKNILLIVSALAILSACSGTPKYADDVPLNLETEADTSSYWWQGFGDPLLDRLVASGRATGLDVQIAQTQIDENKAFTRTQFARLFPSLSLTANSDLTDLPDGVIGLSVDWELDVFGAVRASVKAARLRGLSSEAVVDDIRRLISSQIAATYIQLRARQVECALAENSAERLRQSVERVTRLSEAGYATSLDVTRSTRQLNEVSARISALRGQERALQNALQQLVGDSDDLDLLYNTTVDETFVFPHPATVDPDPEKLFVDRADIRAAALSVNAEAYERLAAKKALYPTISLQGNGVSNGTISAPFALNDLSANIISSLVVPLLGRGRLLAQVDAEDVQAQRALLEYEQIVLAAVTEVDTAQTFLAANRGAAAEQQKALDAATSALAQSRRLFDSGEISYLDVLITEQSRIDSERAFVLSEEAAALSWVQYMTALALK